MRALRLCALATIAYSHCVAAWPVQPRASSNTVPIDLTKYYNNKAFGSRPGEARFDGLNQSYPILPLGENGVYTSTHSGIPFKLPEISAGVAADNLICDSQEIAIPRNKYLSASLLISADLRSTIVTGNLTFNYDDSSNTTNEMRSQPWWTFLSINRGEITFPFFYTANGTNGNASHIYEYTAALDPAKSLSSITLPNTTNVTAGRLHVFALTLWSGDDVQVQTIRPTQKWNEAGDQIIEVIVNNAGSECVAGSGLSAYLQADGVQTTTSGDIKRLCPGDQKSVDVAVKGNGSGLAEVILAFTGTQKSFFFDDVEIGLQDFTAEPDSLLKHEVPKWYDDSKFGIFIHWGPYAVPGWGNSTPFESYSEWFWWYTTHEAADRSGFRDYRLRTFGPDWNYDDTFPEYTASAFNPKEWVDLIADAGAGYFIFTTKHHDGFANFDTGLTTNRSSLHYGPRRDLLRELFSASEQHQPHLKRGTYFSLPEWFNPDWAPYGFSQFSRNTSTTHPGIIARNPFTNLTEPYTGRIPVDDFITDIMRPQMDILAYNYSTDIIWCDAGAANDTDAFAASWFNHIRHHAPNRQVVINDRCGSPWAADHDTPEYHSFATVQRRKWESNRGMDPYSYGYNRATSPEDYMNATEIVATLVDIVSKNGNFLLNLGPKADGTIPEVVTENLREGGRWIAAHKSAIVGTTYWFWGPGLVKADIDAAAAAADDVSLPGQEEKEVVVDLRFTQSDEAFYILSLKQPIVGTMLVEAPVPVLEGDRVVAVGIDGEEREVEWRKSEETGLEIEITEDVVAADEYCWVFKVEYLA